MLVCIVIYLPPSCQHPDLPLFLFWVYNNVAKIITKIFDRFLVKSHIAFSKKNKYYLSTLTINMLKLMICKEMRNQYYEI